MSAQEQAPVAAPEPQAPVAPESRDPRGPVVRWMERVRAGEIWGGPG
jgi:hypothetical protein